MVVYKRIRDLWNSKEFGPILRQYLIQWRREPSIVRLENPTRLDRARSVGYKAKKGFMIVRVRLPSGGRMRMRFKGGRRSKHMRRRLILSKSYQVVAEGRVNRKFVNMAVLNSYFLAKDGKHYFYEVILVDPEIVKTYKGYEWLDQAKHRTRFYHGKTSAGRKSRGLLNKGTGAEKLRPSLRAHKRMSK